MTLSDKLKAAQLTAPSYIRLVDDGAPMFCSECKIRDSKLFVKTFTPDGKAHPAVHEHCLDTEWLSQAKRMEFTI